MFVVKKVNIFSPLHVKRKPRDRETEHAFILGSMNCIVGNTDLNFGIMAHFYLP
jgi:hypothetical protein